MSDSFSPTYLQLKTFNLLICVLLDFLKVEIYIVFTPMSLYGLSKNNIDIT